MSRAREHGFPYKSWGHSTVVAPWGEVIATSNHEEYIVYAEIGEINFDQFSRGCIGDLFNHF